SAVLRERPSLPTGAAPPGTVPLLYEDASCLVVAKPAGVPTIPDRAGKYRGMVGMLQDARPEDDLRAVHRLDRQTSGCLIVAKGLEPAREFDRMFQEHAVHKEYLALVEGRVAWTEREVRRALG